MAPACPYTSGLLGEGMGPAVARVLAGIGEDHGDPTAGQRNT